MIQTNGKKTGYRTPCYKTPCVKHDLEKKLLDVGCEEKEVIRIGKITMEIPNVQGDDLEGHELKTALQTINNPNQ